jgi:hypothetical protein
MMKFSYTFYFIFGGGVCLQTNGQGVTQFARLKVNLFNGILNCLSALWGVESDSLRVSLNFLENMLTNWLFIELLSCGSLISNNKVSNKVLCFPPISIFANN